MHLLVLGGTQFVGLHVVRAALSAGHTVDVFHRGRTVAPDGVGSLIGDRDGDLSALDRDRWDAVVDVSAYVPRQVRDAARRLNGRAGRYVFVSTAAVYRDDAPETREDAPLLDPPPAEVEEVTGATYGGLKVACERTAAATFEGPVLHVRPTYVVGPDDYTRRFASWLRRVRRGGRVAALDGPEAPVAFVDVRDLGRFAVDLCASDATGAVNASGPARPTTWGEVLRIAAEVTGSDAHPVWLERDWVRARDALAGFPMASEYRFRGAAPFDLTRAHALGLAHVDVADSIRATLAWEDAGGAPRAGLDDAAEAALLDAWEAERGG